MIDGGGVRARTQLNHEEHEGTPRKRKAISSCPFAFFEIQLFRGCNANARRYAGLRALFDIFCAQTPVLNHPAAHPERGRQIWAEVTNPLHPSTAILPKCEALC
jgi:hypothetical protein